MHTPPMRLLVLLTVPLILHAQSPRIYNQRLDRQAEELRRLAESTANGQFFEAELQNLEQLTKPTLDRIFSSARRLALARINGTFTWQDIRTALDEIEADNKLTSDRSQDWSAQIGGLQTQIKAARAAADASIPATVEPSLAAQILGHTADASDIFDAAEVLQKRAPSAVSKTDLRVAETLTGLAGQFTNLLDSLHHAAASAPTADDAVRRMNLALLRADLDHVTALARIEMRRLAGAQDVGRLQRTTRRGLNCLLDGATCDGIPFRPGEFAADQTIESTLKLLREPPATADSRLRLQSALYLLQNYAALCARGTTPNRMAEARAAIETRRHGIRRDAIVAQSFEAVLASGAQRIAAYYRGGIRPEALAQLAQALATAGLIPVVAGK